MSPGANPFTVEEQRGQLERRSSMFGLSRVGSIAGAISLIGISAVLTGLLFVALAGMSSHPDSNAQVTAVPQDEQGLVIIRADPLPVSQIMAYLSVPGRISLNGPAATGVPVTPQGSSLSASLAQLNAGDSIKVCTDAPALSVELTLTDSRTNALLGQHVFTGALMCGLKAP